MSAVRTVENDCYTMDYFSEKSEESDTVSVFLYNWIEKNTEAINKQFELAVSETMKDSSDGETIAKHFAYDITSQFLIYFNNMERENISKRQAEGIKAAKERGVRFGRQKKVIPKKFYSVYDSYAKGEISSREAGAQLGVSHCTFLKWIKEINIDKDAQ